MQSVRSKTRPSPKINEYSGPYKTAGDYANALRMWVQQMQQLQFAHCTFPLYIANLSAQASNLSAQTQSTFSTATSPSTQFSGLPQQTQPYVNQQQPAPRGQEFVIPPLWKRFVAELIDFTLLFVIKLAVTYVVIDSFDLLEDLDKYDLSSLGSDILTDYKLALSMTSDLLFLELMHRVGTCLFEALCLQRGPGGIGGATPGKRIMKLRVVRCEFSAPTASPDRAYVYPSTHIGFGRAVLRSVLKNLSMTFLFPICFTFFTFQHNRLVYDFIAGSIVVEERPREGRGHN